MRCLLLLLSVAFASSATIRGTNGADNIQGTTVDDTITALGGDDTVDGRKGDDVLRGSGGNDHLVGGTGGHDKIFGGPGDDYIAGSHTADKLYGGSGDDSIKGGIDNDIIFGGPGNDKLHGSNHWDSIHDSSPGNQVAFDGNDKLYGEGGDGTIPGSDKLFPGTGADVITMARPKSTTKATVTFLASNILADFNAGRSADVVVNYRTPNHHLKIKLDNSLTKAQFGTDSVDNSYLTLTVSGVKKRVIQVQGFDTAALLKSGSISFI